ncbi:hypothetical protein [Rathayibacter rathayi]|uniref:hypothetical protein n=1 Tax=Rathayibacter rathayi TaxID=33887 RepID=UPI0015E1FF2D|nr:hypothetical protein [Rathayibacter rathayi]
MGRHPDGAARSRAATAATVGSSVLLTERDCVHDVTLAVLAESSKNEAFLLGGEPTLTADVDGRRGGVAQLRVRLLSRLLPGLVFRHAHER